jgi:hypothetical protein
VIASGKLTLVSCRTYFFGPEDKEICSSETSVDTPRTTRRYIPEGGTLHNHRGENLKSYMLEVIKRTHFASYTEWS